MAKKAEQQAEDRSADIDQVEVEPERETKSGRKTKSGLKAEADHRAEVKPEPDAVAEPDAEERHAEAEHYEGLDAEERAAIEQGAAMLAEAATVLRNAPAFGDLVESLALVARDGVNAWSEAAKPSPRRGRPPAIPDWIAQDVVPGLRYQRKMTLAHIARHLSEPPYNLRTADGRQLSTSHIQYLLKRSNAPAAA